MSCLWVTHYSHSASLQLGVQTGTDQLLGDPDKCWGSLVMDKHPIKGAEQYS